MLRDYQQKAIDMTYTWMRNNEGNPCIVMPTGAGKSHVIAAMCKNAVMNWPDTRILMLTHSMELIEQNAHKMRQHWPGAPMGIYSASLGMRELGEPITFAGIQSVRKLADKLGRIDLCIVDEAHSISHKEEGGYRTLINQLQEKNNSMRVIGLTASPYRLGHGMITDKPAIFDAIIEPVKIEELIAKGHLSILRSKKTDARLDVTGVHMRGGEYIEAELQAAVDNADINELVVNEIIDRAMGRRSWMIFCSGVAHAMNIRDLLVSKGISAESVTGDVPKSERVRITEEFKSGRIKALTSRDCLTTGFDAPDIDLIAMLRPTMSPGLYLQMAGRGMRIKSHADHCLVLDFAGNIDTHGPITHITPPRKKGKGDGDSPVKDCPECHELVHVSARACPACGYEFPKKEKSGPTLRDDDIMNIKTHELEVSSWSWRVHIGKSSGKQMLMVIYYGALSDPPVKEYLTVLHDGYAGTRAVSTTLAMAKSAGVEIDGDDDIGSVADAMTAGIPPATIEYTKDGMFHRVTRRIWNETQRAGAVDKVGNGNEEINLSKVLPHL